MSTLRASPFPFPAPDDAVGAVTTLLRSLGEDPSRPGLRGTPERVTRSLDDLTAGSRQTPEETVGGAIFPEDYAGLVTPLYARVGRKLIESLRNCTVVTSDRARTAFAIRPRPLREAIARALSREDAELADTRWPDAFSSAALPPPWGGARFGTRLVDSRALVVDASPPRAFAPVRRLGGRAGWYWGNAMWKLRGVLDLAVGGAGLRRGRRDPERLRVGEAVDFWRVEGYEEGRLLRLAAEMRLPGRAWLQFEVTPLGESRSEIRQTAIFDPAGLTGLLYWYALYPFHSLIFNGLLRAISARAEADLPRSGARGGR